MLRTVQSVVTHLEKFPRERAIAACIRVPERQTHNYVRNGTLDLFAALNVATGEVIARCKPQHRAQDFVGFLRDLDAHVEPELEIHIVLDNLSTHKAPPVHRFMLRPPPGFTCTSPPPTRRG